MTDCKKCKLYRGDCNHHFIDEKGHIHYDRPSQAHCDRLRNCEYYENKVPFETVKVELEIMLSQEDIDDIMCGALEGGIAYWCWKAEVIGGYLGEYGSEQISRGGTLRLYDRESGRAYDLTKKRFLKGVASWAKNPVGYNCMEQIDGKIRLDTCNVDAVVCDAIIQYAVFGEVIYAQEVQICRQ